MKLKYIDFRGKRLKFGVDKRHYVLRDVTLPYNDGVGNDIVEYFRCLFIHETIHHFLSKPNQIIPIGWFGLGKLLPRKADLRTVVKDAISGNTVKDIIRSNFLSLEQRQSFENSIVTTLDQGHAFRLTGNYHTVLSSGEVPIGGKLYQTKRIINRFGIVYTLVYLDGKCHWSYRVTDNNKHRYTLIRYKL